MLYKSEHIKVIMDGWIVAFTIPVSIAFVLSSVWITQKLENDNNINKVPKVTPSRQKKNNTILAF